MRAGRARRWPAAAAGRRSSTLIMVARWVVRATPAIASRGTGLAAHSRWHASPRRAPVELRVLLRPARLRRDVGLDRDPRLVPRGCPSRSKSSARTLWVPLSMARMWSPPAMASIPVPAPVAGLRPPVVPAADDRRTSAPGSAADRPGPGTSRDDRRVTGFGRVAVPNRLGPPPRRGPCLWRVRPLSPPDRRVRGRAGSRSSGGAGRRAAALGAAASGSGDRRASLWLARLAAVAARPGPPAPAGAARGGGPPPSVRRARRCSLYRRCATSRARTPASTWPPRCWEPWSGPSTRSSSGSVPGRIWDLRDVAVNAGACALVQAAPWRRWSRRRHRRRPRRVASGLPCAWRRPSSCCSRCAWPTPRRGWSGSRNASRPWLPARPTPTPWPSTATCTACPASACFKSRFDRWPSSTRLDRRPRGRGWRAPRPLPGPRATATSWPPHAGRPTPSSTRRGSTCSAGTATSTEADGSSRPRGAPSRRPGVTGEPDARGVFGRTLARSRSVWDEPAPVRGGEPCSTPAGRSRAGSRPPDHGRGRGAGCAQPARCAALLALDRRSTAGPPGRERRDEPPPPAAPLLGGSPARRSPRPCCPAPRWAAPRPPAVRSGWPSSPTSTPGSSGRRPLALERAAGRQRPPARPRGGRRRPDHRRLPVRRRDGGAALGRLPRALPPRPLRAGRAAPSATTTWWRPSRRTAAPPAATRAPCSAPAWGGAHLPLARRRRLPAPAPRPGRGGRRRPQVPRPGRAGAARVARATDLAGARRARRRSCW